MAEPSTSLCTLKATHPMFRLDMRAGYLQGASEAVLVLLRKIQSLLSHRFTPIHSTTTQTDWMVLQLPVYAWVGVSDSPKCVFVGDDIVALALEDSSFTEVRKAFYRWTSDLRTLFLSIHDTISFLHRGGKLYRDVVFRFLHAAYRTLGRPFVEPLTVGSYFFGELVALAYVANPTDERHQFVAPPPEDIDVEKAQYRMDMCTVIRRLQAEPGQRVHPLHPLRFRSLPLPFPVPGTKTEADHAAIAASDSTLHTDFWVVWLTTMSDTNPELQVRIVHIPSNPKSRKVLITHPWNELASLAKLVPDAASVTPATYHHRVASTMSITLPRITSLTQLCAHVASQFVPIERPEIHHLAVTAYGRVDAFLTPFSPPAGGGEAPSLADLGSPLSMVGIHEHRMLLHASGVYEECSLECIRDAILHPPAIHSHVESIRVAVPQAVPLTAKPTDIGAPLTVVASAVDAAVLRTMTTATSLTDKIAMIPMNVTPMSDEMTPMSSGGGNVSSPSANLTLSTILFLAAAVGILGAVIFWDPAATVTPRKVSKT